MFLVFNELVFLFHPWSWQRCPNKPRTVSTEDEGLRIYCGLSRQQWSHMSFSLRQGAQRTQTGHLALQQRSLASHPHALVWMALPRSREPRASAQSRATFRDDFRQIVRNVSLKRQRLIKTMLFIAWDYGKNVFSYSRPSYFMVQSRYRFKKLYAFGL